MGKVFEDLRASQVQMYLLICLDSAASIVEQRGGVELGAAPFHPFHGGNVICLTLLPFHGVNGEH